MICNNCIHKQLCNEWEKRTEYVKPVSNGVCDHYADATEMVKLPCKVGDTVWFLADRIPVKGEIDYWFTGANELIASVIFGTGQRIRILEKRFGKTVFLTETEARAKLAELEGIE